MNAIYLINCMESEESVSKSKIKRGYLNEKDLLNYHGFYNEKDHMIDFTDKADEYEGAKFADYGGETIQHTHKLVREINLNIGGQKRLTVYVKIDRIIFFVENNELILSFKYNNAELYNDKELKEIAFDQESQYYPVRDLLEQDSNGYKLPSMSGLRAKLTPTSLASSEILNKLGKLGIIVYIADIEDISNIDKYEYDGKILTKGVKFEIMHRGSLYNDKIENLIKNGNKFGFIDLDDRDKFETAKNTVVMNKFTDKKTEEIKKIRSKDFYMISENHYTFNREYVGTILNIKIPKNYKIHFIIAAALFLLSIVFIISMNQPKSEDIPVDQV